MTIVTNNVGNRRRMYIIYDYMMWRLYDSQVVLRISFLIREATEKNCKVTLALLSPSKFLISV